MLTPTMIKYIEDNIDQASKQDFMTTVCFLYNELLEKSYKEIGKLNHYSEERRGSDLQYSKTPDSQFFAVSRSVDSRSSRKSFTIQEYAKKEVQVNQNPVFDKLLNEFRNI